MSDMIKPRYSLSGFKLKRKFSTVVESQEKSITRQTSLYRYLSFIKPATDGFK
jgi:hypothetical protein